MTSLPARSIVTGARKVPSTSSARITGVAGSTDQRRREIRKPSPMPRNEPSSTKFEK